MLRVVDQIELVIIFSILTTLNLCSMKKTLQPSKAFQSAAIRSVLSILLFIFTYLLLIILAIALTVACGYAGILLIMLKPMLVTIAMGGALIVMGLLVLIFLFKFVFKQDKTDRSHLIEVKASDHPELFCMIKELVEEVGTRFPRKVYFSTEVNAAVFYDSTFWSMFFPVRKNLQIGMGLMNSVSVTELRAILAHEFGHFSQRSMKVGSYVYNVNKVLYNILYDNQGYNEMIGNWANSHWSLNLGVTLAVRIVRGIQVLLRKVYEVLNNNYYGLSREMEFHADAVAASVAGSSPLASSLLRLSLANQALDSVLDFYNAKIAESGKAANFYPQQGLVMNYIAEKWKLPVVGGLPQISMDDISKFNRTRLVLKDQWASHPSTEDRIRRLMELDIPVRQQNDSIALTLLNDIAATQELLTGHAFRNVSYEHQPVRLEPGLFWEEFLSNEQKYALPDVFKGYYDARSPYLGSDDEASASIAEYPDPKTLIDEQLIENLKTLDAMRSDLEVLQQIDAGQIEINTFEYDGQRYTPADCSILIENLEAQVSDLSGWLDQRDKQLFESYKAVAIAAGKSAEWEDKCREYKLTMDLLNENQAVYQTMVEAASYMQSNQQFTTIIEKTAELKKLEPKFKARVELLLSDDRFSAFIKGSQRQHLEEYLSKESAYFVHDMYINQDVDTFYIALGDFYAFNLELNFKSKQDFLIFQASLTAGSAHSVAGVVIKSADFAGTSSSQTAKLPII